MDQSKDVLEKESEELCQLMMKQAIEKKLMTGGRMINQNLNLIDKEMKMEQNTGELQHQQRNEAFRQLHTKFRDLGGFLSTHENT